jgi:acyl carrier protein
MTDRQIILQQIEKIFRNILDDEEIILTETTTTNDIEEWDSLIHIQIVVAIERHFNIKFTSKEFSSWKNINEMIDCILLKM